MTGQEQTTYFAAAHAAFTAAEEMIAKAGKWSTTAMAGESFSNQTCCRGCRPECSPDTPAQCVAKIVALVDAANEPNHTLQLKVPMPAWSASALPPFDGAFLERSVAIFLLVRGASAALVMGGQGAAFSYAKDLPWHASLDADYGTPLEATPKLGPGSGGVPLSKFTREWSKATVTYDCGTGKEEIVWKSRRATTAKTDDALPNFVLMLSDDTGWGDVGYHGGKAHTPHLDEMSNAPGVLRLERFYAGAPGTDGSLSLPLVSPRLEELC